MLNILCFFLFNFRLINLKTNNYLCHIFYCLYDLIQVIVHLFNETAELLLLRTPLLKMSSPTTLFSRVVALPEQRDRLKRTAVQDGRVNQSVSPPSKQRPTMGILTRSP